ncbi:DUF2911 domain-containing protein [Persicitalea jodogahamensis]|uniref:DUF2911 domain-containing protein n=1 Tax=Persicitalea jodogahamensis TaxID=402147 RepID=A0A8J3D623_9BACT|nr:DUF2911 domain-containing protein [Persicitalea jodogahamensis]GHB88025.1 hypothetical protein GCM10007390_50040 [Persicitalea jodogahamensis]
MNKYLKWTLIALGGLVVIAFIGFQVMTANTKKASPEQTVSFNEGEKHVEVYYNRPSKKGREIFGGLVPYGEVWRTGANEATTFTTKTELVIDGKMLPAGEYTLWTIPEKDKWTVIFNNKQYSWGVNFDGTPIREAEADVLKVEVPTQVTNSPAEMFTISFDQSIPAMEMAWDMTKVSVPIK